jgi:hypothetical protein
VVGRDNGVSYRRLSLQIPPDRHRHHYVKAKVRVHEYPDGRLIGETDNAKTAAYLRWAADALWTCGRSASALRAAADRLRFPRVPQAGNTGKCSPSPTSPQGQQQRTTYVLFKSDNFTCYRQVGVQPAPSRNAMRRAHHAYPPFSVVVSGFLGAWEQA